MHSFGGPAIPLDPSQLRALLQRPLVAWHPTAPLLATADAQDRILVSLPGALLPPEDPTGQTQRPTSYVLAHESQAGVQCLAWRPAAASTLAVGCLGGVMLWSLDKGVYSCVIHFLHTVLPRDTCLNRSIWNATAKARRTSRGQHVGVYAPNPRPRPRDVHSMVILWHPACCGRGWGARHAGVGCGNCTGGHCAAGACRGAPAVMVPMWRVLAGVRRQRWVLRVGNNQVAHAQVGSTR